MNYVFKKEDIGKKVSLLLDIKKLSNYFFEKEDCFKEIPCNAIIDYRLSTIKKDRHKRKIVNSGPTKRKVNLLSVVMKLGANHMLVGGDIVEGNKDYVKIKKENSLSPILR